MKTSWFILTGGVDGTWRRLAHILALLVATCLLLMGLR